MKTWEKFPMIIYVMYGNPLPNNLSGSPVAMRPQVTKVPMVGYNFIPTWDEQLRANLAQS